MNTDRASRHEQGSTSPRLKPGASRPTPHFGDLDLRAERVPYGRKVHAVLLTAPIDGDLGVQAGEMVARWVCGAQSGPMSSAAFDRAHPESWTGSRRAGCAACAEGVAVLRAIHGSDALAIEELDPRVVRRLIRSHLVELIDGRLVVRLARHTPSA